MNCQNFLIFINIVIFSVLIKICIAQNVQDIDNIDHHLEEEQEEEDICTNEDCVKLSNEIRASLNTKVDPCRDFFEFSCGSWGNRHPMPDDHSRFSISHLMEDQMNQLIYDALFRSVKTSSNAVQYSKHIFKQCIHYEYNPSDGDRLVKELITSVVGNWTIGEPQTFSPTETNLKWYQLYVTTVVSGAIFPLFWFSVNPDPNNVTVNMLSLDSVGFSIGDEELQNLTDNNLNQSNPVEEYRSLIEKSAKLFCTKNQTLLRSHVEDIVELESYLANSKTVQKRDPTTWYKKMSIQELSEKTNFDWFALVIEPLLTGFKVQNISQVSNSSWILVSDIDYLTRTVEIMDKLNPRFIQNYFGWKVMEEYGDYSSRNMRQYEFEFEQSRTGVKQPTPPWKTCFDLVNNDFPFALSRLFVQENFLPAEKAKATKLISEIQQSFEMLIKNNRWIDPVTKAKSLKKLAKVRINVGYPDWLLKDDQLDTFYGLTDKLTEQLLIEENFLQAFVKFGVNQRQVEFDKLFEPVNVDMDWPMSPASVNAAYEPEQNSITIPAGILKTPNFNFHYPPSVNFGAIGAVIGHEFTHGLDDQGRQFDSLGNLQNWWTNESIVSFENRSQCFVEQYGTMRDETVDMNINGLSTLGENIADNGGIRQAFHAFKRYKTKHSQAKMLPNLPQFDQNQLFFISYAQTWCSSIRPESLRLQIEYDPHAPSQFRVNIPVSNLPEFASAFKCPAGSPMNPYEKCILW